MKKKILLLFIFTSIYSSAQVPGYYGKRNYISYSAWMHPNVDIFGEPLKTEGTVLDVIHAFALDHVVSHRGAVCFTFQFARIGMPDFNAEDSFYIYSGKNKYPAYLHSRGFSIGYKLFARDKIAPLGKYIKWDAIVIFNKLIYNPTDVYDTRHNTRLTEVDKNINSQGGGLALSFGRQRIFYDKIIVDGGFRVAMVICPSYYSTPFAGRFFYSTERTIFNQFVNFRLGIGFVAF